MYSKFFVGIAINPNKKYTFSIEDRLAITRECVKHLPNVTVTSVGSEFLVRYARRYQISQVLRGLRTAADFDYENMMSAVNADIAPEVTTVMIVCPPDLAKISSSMVKGLVGNEGWQDVLKPYVPLPVHKAMVARFPL